MVLTGGASRRMGRDKATLSIPAIPGPAGTTMVEQVVSVLGQRCDPIFVVAAADQQLPDLPARLLRDEEPGRGPLLATGHGLHAAAQEGAVRAFVCAVDMPFLTAGLIDTLAVPAARLDADVVLPWDGRDHYLAGVYRTRLWERIDALVAAGEARMGALAGTVDTQRIVLADSRPLANLNSPADLAALAPS